MRNSENKFPLLTARTPRSILTLLIHLEDVMKARTTKKRGASHKAPGKSVLSVAISTTVYQAFKRHIGPGMRLNHAVEAVLEAAMKKRPEVRSRELMP